LPNRNQVRFFSSIWTDLSQSMTPLGTRLVIILLQEVANRLSALLPMLTSGVGGGDVAIARVGGDEFVVILPSMSREAVSSIARNLIEGLQSPFEVSGLRMSVGASIGVTLFPNDGSSYDDLLINADLAMYAAKKRGRNTFAFFTLEIGEQARERVAIESDLKEVVRAHQLAVQYQPKVSCRDGQICGVEALVAGTIRQKAIFRRISSSELPRKRG